MDRRGFLGAILATGVAPAIIRSGILMPIKGIIMPMTEEIGAFVGFNTLLTPSMITAEALRILEQNLTLSNLVNKRFEKQFVETGSTLIIRNQKQIWTAN